MCRAPGSRRGLAAASASPAATVAEPPARSWHRPCAHSVRVRHVLPAGSEAAAPDGAAAAAGLPGDSPGGGLALTGGAVRHQPADFALHSGQGLASRLLSQQPDALQVVEGQQVLGPVALGKGAPDQRGPPAASRGRWQAAASPGPLLRATRPRAGASRAAGPAEPVGQGLSRRRPSVPGEHGRPSNAALCPRARSPAGTGF